MLSAFASQVRATSFKFCHSLQYEKLLSPQIRKAMQESSSPTKLKSRQVCKKYFESLYSRGIREKQLFNMIYSASFQLERVEQYRPKVCDLIVERRIKSQSQLDKVVKLIFQKRTYSSPERLLGEVDGLLDYEGQSEGEFRAKCQQQCLADPRKFASLSTSQLCKQYREEFPEVQSKIIYERIESLKKQHKEAQNNGSGHEEKSETNKFWDRLSNIRPRMLKEEVNSPQIYAEHLNITKNAPRFRFPPEPNGYLHIGHLKSIRINFESARRLGGSCYLRYDDTNPDKETHEYIEEIEKNVRWMGYEPDKITFTSDYFEQMLGFANQLIKQGKAYVCESEQTDLQAERRQRRKSPYRDSPIERSLKVFPHLQPGQTLRLALDHQSPNPTLRDPIIYRHKAREHPRTGSKYKIYPMYDFAHCISDSLQHIDYSLCSLEFEIRRELYYKILDLLGLYKPKVWEFSRINIEGSVISKRKIKDLIDNKKIQGWDDPRLLTIRGMQRRGFTPQILKNFIDQANCSRSGNENFIRYQQLQKQMKKQLSQSSKKIMAVEHPIEVSIILPHQNDPQTLSEASLSHELVEVLAAQNQILIEISVHSRLERGKLCILKEVGVYEVIEKEGKTCFLKSVLSVQEAKKTQKEVPILSWVGKKRASTQQTTVFSELIIDNEFNPESKRTKLLTFDSLMLESISSLDCQKPFLVERFGYFKRDRQLGLICCAEI